MDKKNKTILIGLGMLVLGGIIGYTMALRSVGMGPLAQIQSMQSSAQVPGPGRCQREKDTYYYWIGMYANNPTNQTYLAHKNEAEAGYYACLNAQEGGGKAPR